ncbi:MAG: hypothetical protein ACR2PT_12055 [Endozoicomonas sp.]
MATNGESARRWLEENQDRVSLERIRQIRDNIVSRLQSLDEQDETHEGLLEALDVMDEHLIETEQPEPPGNDAANVLLDSSPLVSSPPAEPPHLSREEKQRRFRRLLETGKI